MAPGTVPGLTTPPQNTFYDPARPRRLRTDQTRSQREAVATGPVLLLWRSGDLPGDLREPGPGITVPDARGL